MKLFATVAAAGAILLATGACHARSEPTADANGDGKITLAEMQASRVDRMMKMDTDHDGKVSLAEFAAGMKARMAERGGDAGAGPDPSAMFQRTDLDGDGFITKAEIEQSTAKRFARMDADNKGYVTADQMGHRHGGGGGGGGGGGE